MDRISCSFPLSNFYGAYKEMKKQAQGEVVPAINAAIKYMNNRRLCYNW